MPQRIVERAGTDTAKAENALTPRPVPVLVSSFLVVVLPGDVGERPGEHDKGADHAAKKKDIKGAHGSAPVKTGLQRILRKPAQGRVDMDQMTI